ncbi:MAG: hypothetical protein WB698_00150 [Solirubrobacteraceae bacterium]
MLTHARLASCTAEVLVLVVGTEEQSEHVVGWYRVLVCQDRPCAPYKVTERRAALGRQGVVTGSLEDQERVNDLA